MGGITMKRDFITILALAVIAVVIIGEVVVYTSNTNDFNINAEKSGDEMSCEISVNGTQVYSVIAMDNGSMLPLTEIYVYYDKDYATNYKYHVGPLGSNSFTQEYYIDQLVKLLKNSGAASVRILSAAELEIAMNDDIGTSFQKGLVSISGALPDTIYSGSPSDDIFAWLNDGGRLYWAGNLLGAYIATADGLKTAPAGYQSNFFGTECLNGSDVSFVNKDDMSNTLRYDLSLKNNHVKFAVDASLLSKANKTMGFTNGTYSSTVMVEYGDGMICVLGGDLRKEQCSDLVQLLSSNITYSTNIINVKTGDIQFGKITEKIDVTGFSGNISIYAYLGGYFQVYGKFFSFA